MKNIIFARSSTHPACYVMISQQHRRCVLFIRSSMCERHKYYHYLYLFWQEQQRLNHQSGQVCEASVCLVLDEAEALFVSALLGNENNIIHRLVLTPWLYLAPPHWHISHVTTPHTKLFPPMAHNAERRRKHARSSFDSWQTTVLSQNFQWAYSAAQGNHWQRWLSSAFPMLSPPSVLRGFEWENICFIYYLVTCSIVTTEGFFEWKRAWRGQNFSHWALQRLLFSEEKCISHHQRGLCGLAFVENSAKHTKLQHGRWTHHMSHLFGMSHDAASCFCFMNFL